MLAVQITFKDIANSQSLEAHIKEKAQKLTQFYQRIQSCRVVVEVPQKHKHQGKLFSVNIDLTVPGKELVVSHKQNQDVYVAIRDAFHAIERQLEKYARRRRGDVKAHDHVFNGVIVRLFMNEGYGFIRGFDGDEFYFSANNVIHPQFENLEIGDKVQFIGLSANEGLQANRITLAKHVAFNEESYL